MIDMRPTILLCLWNFCGCLLLDLCECIHQCGPHQFRIVWENGTFKTCLVCHKCHEGHGLYPGCGKTIKHPPMVECKACVDGKTFSEEYDSSMCKTCQSCAHNEVVTQKCTHNSDTNCSGTCSQDYFFSKAQDCQKCSYCCLDGKDQRQPECISKGLNAEQQCSPRLDRTCGPDPTTTATPTTNQLHGKIPFILSGVVCGVLIVVLVLGAVYWQRTKMRAAEIHANATFGDIQNPQREDSQGAQITLDHMSVGLYKSVEPHNATPHGSIPQGQGSYGAEPINVLMPKIPRLNQGYDSNHSTPNGLRKAIPGHRPDQLESPKVDTKRPNPWTKDPDEPPVPQRQGSHGVEPINVLMPKIPRLNPGYDSNHSTPNGLRKAIPGHQADQLESPKVDTKRPNPCTKDPDEPPDSVEIVEHPKKQRQQEGSRVELKCRVNGGKEVIYQWFHDEEKMPEEKSSSLIFASVEVHDFGFYYCEVRSCATDRSNSRPLKSETAELDVTPHNGKRYSSLSEVFRDSLEKETKVENLLMKKIGQRKAWKQVAHKYGMDLDAIEISKEPGVEVVECLKAHHPDLTVYDFCKILKCPDIRRLDIVKELSSDLCRSVSH